MSTSLFTYVCDVISQGYPFLEAIVNLLPLADELVIVDCDSKDGTKEFLLSLNNPNIKIFHDKWVNGLGGRNHHKTGSMCHDVCTKDTIIFVEADEIWSESLVDSTKVELQKHNNFRFWRYQITQNFQRVFWYPERDQLVNRIFPRGSEIMRGGKDIFIQDSNDAKSAIIISNDNGYIVDCRNCFRDNYLARENFAKTVWAEEKRSTTRMAPAHAAYSWEMNQEQFQKELQDERWLWKTTIFNIPEILKYHLGRTSYEMRPELIERLKNWKLYA